MPTPSTRACLIAWIALAPSVLLAAPITEESPAKPQAVHPEPAVSPSADQRKTMDLLLELQPRSAGLEFKERALPARSGVPSTSGDVRAINRPKEEIPEMPETKASAPSLVNASGLFGTAAVNPAAATPRSDTGRRPASTGTEPWADGAARTAHSSSARPSSEVEELARIWLIPREIVEYVRDHREWFIAGGVTLGLLLWVGGGGLARVRQRA